MTGLPAIARGWYRRLVSADRRRDLYRLLHRADYRRLRTAVFPSPKGTFSLRRCDSLQAIFIHVPKAAGTSVALSLFGELPYHYTAADYRAIFGRRTFDAYFKFAFVRNPWDRVHSAWTYLRAGGWDARDRAWAAEHLAPYADFGDFVRRGLRRNAVQEFMHFRPQSAFVCDRWGRLHVDHLGYFETLEADFEVISRRLGVAATLQHVNRSTATRYLEHYAADTLAIVGTVYRDDVTRFGYEVGGIRQRMVVGG